METKTDSESKRPPNRGFVLLSTLAALIIVASLTIAIQQHAFVNTRQVKKLSDRIVQNAQAESLRNLLRPAIGEAMLATDAPQAQRLNGQPSEYTLENEQFLVSVQDVNGLIDVRRTPNEAAQAVLSASQFEFFVTLKASYDPDVPLSVQVAALRSHGPALRVTNRGASRFLNSETLSVHYSAQFQAVNNVHFRNRQTRLVRTKIAHKR